MQATKAVLTVPGGAKTKVFLWLNPRRTDLTITLRNSDRPEPIMADRRVVGRATGTVKLERPVSGAAVKGEASSGSALDGAVKVEDSGFGLIKITIAFDPPERAQASPGGAQKRPWGGTSSSPRRQPTMARTAASPSREGAP